MYLQAVAGVMVMLFAAASLAGSPIRGAKEGVAIDGHDAVAYFTKKAAVKGSPQHTHEWNGVKWLFFSAEHRDLFAANPERYAPQYGGFCAYGVASGYISKKVGYEDAWSVHDGKLYMFPDRGAQAAWFRTGGQGNVRFGDQNWPKLKATLEAQ